MLRFAEDACVQCGLCKATCPEKVISLVPQIDFRAATAASRVLKEEEPFHCIRCGKLFGVKSMIERAIAKLEGKHWMYQGSVSRLDAIKMCEACRVAAVTEREFDPHGAPARPTVRTTDDYLPGRGRKPPTRSAPAERRGPRAAPCSLKRDVRSNERGSDAQLHLCLCRRRGHRPRRRRDLERISGVFQSGVFDDGGSPLNAEPTFSATNDGRRGDRLPVSSQQPQSAR
jgi:ferredoxin